MPKHIPRIIINRANPLEVYNGIEFKRCYRFSKETFLILANDIINSNINNRGCPLSSVQQLAIAFRFYATGSFQVSRNSRNGIRQSYLFIVLILIVFLLVIRDLVELKVNQSTACRVVKNISIQIANKRHQYIKFPTEADSLIIRQRFYQIKRFPGCMGAIDGTHIPIIKPGGENPEIYRKRKGFFSLNCQVIAGP
ncbi:putative nuclease HARBI1 [Hydra vulgaris]|uniref:Nuclease HARBI1 n=1 Tax=Hydra vulgaris TaxID=6087 RepID=A0ABM4DQ83_HYDVU